MTFGARGPGFGSTADSSALSSDSKAASSSSICAEQNTAGTSEEQARALAERSVEEESGERAVQFYISYTIYYL